MFWNWNEFKAFFPDMSNADDQPLIQGETWISVEGQNRMETESDGWQIESGKKLIIVVTLPTSSNGKPIG